MSRTPQRFEDRETAGRQLAKAVRDRGIEPDIVLAIPRGALPVGHAVAEDLNVPLDIVAAKKIGAPGNPEFAIGAVVDDGTLWRNDEVIDRYGVDEEYISEKRAEKADEAREKLQRYRGAKTMPPLAGKRVLIVDDGIATGATARACIARVRAQDASNITFAAPVGSPRAIADLEGDVDEVICLLAPEHFRAVGQFYERFEQVTDEEAVRYLA